MILGWKQRWLNLLKSMNRKNGAQQVLSITKISGITVVSIG